LRLSIDDGAHLLAQAVESPEPVEYALAPEEFVGGSRQFGLMRAQPEALIGAMLGQITRHDAVLQHAAERQCDAARRPGEAAGHRVVGGEQHHGAEDEGSGAARRSGERYRAAPCQEYRECRRQKSQQQHQGGAVACSREGHQHDQTDAFTGAERVAANHEEVEREHTEPGEHVGQQNSGEPGQGGGQRQYADGDEEDDRAAAEPLRAQHQRDHPHGHGGLYDHGGPEVRPRQRDQKQAVDGGAADFERALVPAREVAAGVVFEKREAVPQRGNQEQQD